MFGSFFKSRPRATTPAARPNAQSRGTPTGKPPASQAQRAQRPQQAQQQPRPTRNDHAPAQAQRARAQVVEVPEDEIDAIPARAPGMARRASGGATLPQPAQQPARRAPRVPAREPGPEEIEKLLAYEGRVLTAEGGEIAIGASQRKVLAALDDGILVVAKSAQTTSQVFSANVLLEKSSYRVNQVLLVELEVVRKIYEAHARRFGTGEAGKDTAQMQRAVLDLIKNAARLRCSDIHITVRRHEAIIRLRSDGVMMKLDDLDSENALLLCQAAFNMADASDAAYKPFDYQGARISSLKTSLPEGVQAVRLQFNPLPDGGRYLVMRLLYNQKVSGPTDVDKLGYAASHVRQIKRMRDKPYGLVVISGPTGSGKSTTLQTALQATAQLKNFEVNIITVEDPPEYEIPAAAQLPVVNVKSDEERREAFRAAITASLRSDPDIVMIGEIRDEASASLAFQAAMTGHQVYASLHANDALSILDRLRDQKVENYKLSDASLVTGLIGQRLVRQLCDKCKLSFDEARSAGIISGETGALVEALVGADIARDHVCAPRPGGCENCSHRGYSGRTVIAETILTDRKLMEFVSNDDKHGAFNYWLDHLDGMTMLEHAILKMAMGQVDPREIGDKVGILDEASPERTLRLVSDEVVPLLLAQDTPVRKAPGLLAPQPVALEKE